MSDTIMEAIMSPESKEFYTTLQEHRAQDKMVEFYEKYASGYDKAHVEQRYDEILDSSARLLKEYLLEKGETPIESYEILDVACGSGMTGIELKKAGFQLIDGVDPAHGMIKLAEEKKIYRKLLIGKLTASEKFEFSDRQYDGLLAGGCIGKGHIAVKDALPEFLRLLKSGGIAVYTVSPTLDNIKSLGEHLKYFGDTEGKFQLLKIERKFFYDQLATDGTYCYLYSVKKI